METVAREAGREGVVAREDGAPELRRVLAEVVAQGRRRRKRLQVALLQRALEDPQVQPRPAAS